MITAVIFDRDGVLTDFDIPAAALFFQSLVPVPVEELSDLWDEWGQKVGFPCNLDEEIVFWQGFWRHLAETHNLSTAVLDKLQQVDYWDFIRPFPDARAALQNVRQRGLRSGVLSNFSLASLGESLTAVGLADLVDEVCAAPVIGVSKPHPEAYLTICRALGVPPEQCLFFDDEAPCVEGAREVGMVAYLVNRENKGHNFADGVVGDLTAVRTILDMQVP